MENKCKYIGIRGHRGSGKNTIAYLLGCTLQWIRDNNVQSVENLLNDPVFGISWRVWCECIIQDEQKALDNMDTANVYLESFGYMPKMLVELITNIPHEYIESDYYKDHVVVDVRDFSWKVEEKVTNVSSYKALIAMVDELGFDNIQKDLTKLTLRDFIVYFATVSMKYLGRSIWVKAVRCNEHKYDDFDSYYNIGTCYKIYKDIKAPSELSYVKDHDGVIIKVTRPGNEKSNKGVEQLKDDDRYDYSIINTDITNDLEFRKQIVNIAFDVYEK